MSCKISNVYKPKECIKYMHVEMHPDLLAEWYSANITEEVTSTGAQVKTVSHLCHPALIMWSRKIPPELTSLHGQVQLRLNEDCGHALYVMHVDVLVDHVINHSLAADLKHIRDLAGRTLTLILYGTADYFKGLSRRKKTKRASKEKQMTDIDLEMALTDLLVSADCDAVKVNTPYELASFISQMTKAIAIAPYKQSQQKADEQAQFYVRGENKDSVGVTKDGHGVSQLWHRMVASMPKSSLEVSRELCALYKTPRELYDVLRTPSGLVTVADTVVYRSALPDARGRRLGDEMASRLHTLFTCDDGNVLISSE